MAMTVEKIKAAVDSLFSDTTCPQEKTKECLEEVIEYIKGCLESLD
ncbi:hypothetical protein LCGC14_2317160 [marine sediment metagenome]|uniref:Uncharacterized protein n=1 Tax=marine sediment metagenome TaxID=412755 RepID=A0A0F9CJK0_9ZZZZ